MIRKDFGTIIFIGRFQGLHNAHAEILRRAHELADRVIVVIGSANQPRTAKNPFTYGERMSMVLKTWNRFAKIENNEIVIVSAEDKPYNDVAWAVDIQKKVEPYIIEYKRVGLIGHRKDSSSFYLDMFPQWDTIDQPLLQPIHAADIRELYFKRDGTMEYLRGVVPKETYFFLEQFRKSEHFENILWQKEFLAKYKLQFAGFPYDITFVTADAVVIQSGNVLMTRRGPGYGQGLLALPGGFLNARKDRSMLDAAVRELYEETNVKIAEKVLRGSLRATRVFDAIDRSERGRTITHAFSFLLHDGYELPKVKGGDDAAEAFWMPIGQIERDQCFEDHYDIIEWAVENA